MKDRILTLLDEIKEVCEKEKIPFYLAGELAFRASRGEELKDNFSDAAIMIFAGDAKRLTKKLLKRNKARVVESLRNNPSFPGFYLRYSDTETTLVNTRERINYNTNSIGVNIELICSVPGEGFKHNLLTRMKGVWLEKFRPSYIEAGEDTRSAMEKFQDICLKVFFQCFGTERTMKKVFDRWIRQGKRESSKYTIAMPNSVQVNFSKNLFEPAIPLRLEGKEYPAPAKIKSYLRVIYAGDIPRQPRKDMLYDVNVPWRQYRQAMQKEGLELEQVQKNRRKYLDWRYKNYVPLWEKRIYYYSLIFCSEERVRFWREYKTGKKEHVVNLYEAGKYAQAGEELNEYFGLMRYYAEKGVGFCFDKEILEISIKLLMLDIAGTVRKKSTYKKKCGRLLDIVESVPYQHFDEIEKAFMGDRADPEELKQEKELTYKRLVQFCDAHCVQE